jgi:hypothetical protein
LTAFSGCFWDRIDKVVLGRRGFVIPYRQVHVTLAFVYIWWEEFREFFGKRSHICKRRENWFDSSTLRSAQTKTENPASPEGEAGFFVAAGLIWGGAGDR